MNIRLLFACLGIMVVLSSCTPERTLNSTPSVTPELKPQIEATNAIPSVPSPVGDETPSASFDIETILEMLLSEEPEERDSALKQILASKDPRFIAVLIEMMRAAQTGLVPLIDYPSVVEALEILSGINIQIMLLITIPITFDSHTGCSPIKNIQGQRGIKKK